VIRDKSSLDRLVLQWNAIEELRERFDPLKYIAGGKIITESGSPAESYNLLMMLAYASLDEVLSQFIEEEIFCCRNKKHLKKAPLLGTKMQASRDRVTWKDYDAVFEGKEARNRLAHNSLLSDKNSCLKHVSAVRNELQAWGLLDG
jgi:hypothetical protein